jgi:hypothetical protein
LEEAQQEEMADCRGEATCEALSATGRAGIEPDMTEKKNRLTETEREAGRRIVKNARHLISKAAKKDYSLLWALRRYVYTRLIYDERGTPMQRRSLKRKKIISQRGLCAICKKKLPKAGAELDRRRAIRGYTGENTRLVHHKCHRRSQQEKGFV